MGTRRQSASRRAIAPDGRRSSASNFRKVIGAQAICRASIAWVKPIPARRRRSHTPKLSASSFAGVCAMCRKYHTPGRVCIVFRYQPEKEKINNA
jgi:ribosomal protein L32